ncbi:MAG: HEAT repeat domain-containing protein [Planctomycetota bacterium]|jgi:HEAT repeat protein
MKSWMKIAVFVVLFVLCVCLPLEAEPLKALIVTGQSGQYHNWRVSSPVLERLLEQTGLFDIDVVKSSGLGGDMASFKPNFADYDVVVVDYEGDSWPEQTKAAFVEYVDSGGGVVIYHAADNAFPKWAEFNEIIGLGGWGDRDERSGPMVRFRDGEVIFDDTPGKAGSHPPKHDFQIVVRDKGHPITAGLPEKWMHALDELYGQLRGPAKNLSVLATAYSDPAQKSGTGEHEPILFTINYGKGRVFHTVLGHVGAKDKPPITALDCVGFIVTFQRGAEWAATGKVTQKVPEDFPTATEVRVRKSCKAVKSLDELLSEIAGYEFGQSRESLTELADIIRESYDSEQQRKDIEERLLDFIRSDATLAGKQFVCRQLSIIGGEETVPTLAAMLAEVDTADMARYALERIPGAAVDEALRQALLKTTGKTRIGVINTLGLRGDNKSVSTLSGLIYDSDSATAAAAVAALGQIASPQAAEVLAQAKDKTSDKLREQVLDAYLSCADRLAAQGKRQQALHIYNELYKPDEPVPIRTASLRGMATAVPQDADEIIIDVLEGKDETIQTVAIGLVREIPQIDVGAVSGELRKLSVTGQVQLLSALADRGDPGALRAVTRATKSKKDAVRVAALKALGKLGDASSVSLLAQRAAKTKDAEQEAARESLYRLSGPKVDETILAGVSKAKGKVKIELIRSIGERKVSSAVETLLRTAQDRNDDVRLESIKALRNAAEPKHVSKLVDLLINTRSETDLKEAEKTLVSVSRKSVGQENVTAVVLNAISSVEDVKVRCSLLSVLGAVGDSEGLGMLRTALKDSNPEVQTAAIRALSNWPNAEPAGDLKEIVSETSDEIQRGLALRGFVHLIGLESDRPAHETVEMYREAMGLASNVDEKKLVLSRLSGIKSFAALYMASDYLKEDALQQEAGTAMVKIAEFTRHSHPQQTKMLLQMLIQTSKNDSLRQQAEEVLEKIRMKF